MEIFLLLYQYQIELVDKKLVEIEILEQRYKTTLSKWQGCNVITIIPEFFSSAQKSNIFYKLGLTTILINYQGIKIKQRMLLHHSANKLESDLTEINMKINIWKLNNTFLDNLKIKEKKSKLNYPN